MLAALWLIACAIAGPASAQTNRAEEDALKAAFLFHVAKFVQWPAPTTGPLLICSATDDAFGELLARLVRGQNVDGRELLTRQIKEGDDPADCDTLFVASGRQRYGVELLQRSHGPVLTVGETVQFMRDGGMIRVFVENNRLRFQINNKTAEAGGLKLSSRLLTLAVP